MSARLDRAFRRLKTLGRHGVLQETPQVSGDTRFLKGYFLPARLLPPALRLADDPAGLQKVLAKAGRERPRGAEYSLWEGYALFLTGDLRGAEESLGRALSLDRKLTAALILRGMVRLRSGEWKSAASDYSAAIRLDPSCPGLFTLRAFARFQGGDRNGAVQDAHRAITLHPENLDGFVRLLFLIAGKSPPRDPEAQREILTRAAEGVIAEEPDCAWAHAVLAEVVGRRGASSDPERSARELETAARLEPRRAWVRAFLGRALMVFHEESRTRQALRHADRAVRVAPGVGWIRCWRAQVAKELGKSREALKDLDAGLRLDPGYGLALAWRADLRESLGDLRGALADWTACLEALPRPSFRRRRAQLLRRLRR